tara:strand:+ start:912 stop:1829 length:918 start_codon:yes stop_codon:yes gene_type:complete
MAKNRSTIITELFEAFAKNDDFEYSEDQLWEVFNSCVEKKLIKKLSKPREAKEDGAKSRGKSGYQHFLSEFSDPIPDGMKKREFKGAVWAKFSQEEKAEWKRKADEVNEAAGIHKKPAPIKTSQEDNDKYEELLIEWSNKDPDTRGPMPSRPTSPKSPPTSSPKVSPKEHSSADNSTGHSDPESSDDEDLAQRLEQLQMKTDSDDDDDDDDDNEEDNDGSDDDDDDHERLEWLKLHWSEQGLKKNASKHFLAWIMFTNKDIFGPNKDNTMSQTQFGDFKKTHDYSSKAKDEGAPWYEFLTKNRIV